MSMAGSEAELASFERGDFDPAAFPHEEHVRIARAFLLRHPFAEALPRLSRGIKAMGAKAGRPEAYHETITTAFLSLVAERIIDSPAASFGDFKSANPALFDKATLLRLYTPERLGSASARATFLLPDLAGRGR
jgi:hypothetical protein